MENKSKNKVCPICKNKFSQNCRSQIYCSHKCRGISRTKVVCGKCGSFDLDPGTWGTPGIPKLCKSCFEVWRTNRHNITVKCKDCGKTKIIKYHIKKEYRHLYQCQVCNPTLGKGCSRIVYKVKNCPVCKENFQPKTWKQNQNKYCSPKCNKHRHQAPGLKCVICNEILNNKNKTHTSSALKCDACMYYYRRIYKTKERLGVDKKTAEKLVAISVISTTGLVEIKTIKRKEKTCTNRTKTAERILISNP